MLTWSIWTSCPSLVFARETCTPYNYIVLRLSQAKITQYNYNRALKRNSDAPQFCHYNCIFANIWYLILLIQSYNILLPIFMFYKHCVLADFWGRKDSAIGKLFIADSMWTSQWHASLRLWVAQIGAPFGAQNAVFVKHNNMLWNADLSCLWLEFVGGIQYRQIYSYNGKIEVDKCRI